ncbi:MAG: hypothetical protein AAFW67_06240 [Cyanobacteria bacterium J06638_38]
MKPRSSQKNNLSLQLVTLMAAVSSIVFRSAIAVQAANVPKLTDDLAIAKDINSQSLTTKALLIEQKQLIAQVWSDLNADELSLATSPQTPANLAPASNLDSLPVTPVTVTQLDNQQQQLIAQVWSELEIEG